MTVVSGYDEKLPFIKDFRGLIYRSPAAGQPAHLLPDLADRNSLHRRLLWQVLFLLCGGGRRAVWLAIIGLLNSGLASAYYLRLAFACVERSPDAEATAQAPPLRVGVAVSAALAFAAAATLILGIVPTEVLRASESAAHTLRPLATQPESQPFSATDAPNH